MNMRKILGARALASAAVLMFGTCAASAATLSLVGGNATTLPGNYDPNPGIAGVGPGFEITSFAAGDTGQGLYLDTMGGAVQLTFTSYGSEAGHVNVASSGMIGNTNNLPANAGQSFVFTPLVDGFVDLFFEDTDDGSFYTNGAGGSDAALAAAVVDNIGYFFFSDGAGDSDWDDLVGTLEVSAVPLPMGAALLLTGLGGLVAMRRKK